MLKTVMALMSAYNGETAIIRIKIIAGSNERLNFGFFIFFPF
jgi:hypothetical protein